jgi:hypothetical protein
VDLEYLTPVFNQAYMVIAPLKEMPTYSDRSTTNDQDKHIPSWLGAMPESNSSMR